MVTRETTGSVRAPQEARKRGGVPIAAAQCLRGARAEQATTLLRRLRVAGAWRNIAGTPLSRWSRAIWFEPATRTVTIVVGSESWRRALESHRETLLAGLTAASRERIDRIEMRVDESAFPAIVAQRTEAPPVRASSSPACPPAAVEGEVPEEASARAAGAPPLRAALEILRDRYLSASTSSRG